MKPRYNLRLATKQQTSTSVKPSPRIKKAKERRGHVTKPSLRSAATVKEAKCRSPVPEKTVKCSKVDRGSKDEKHCSDGDWLARHHKHMLEEQRDRKLYERHVRDQQTIRRLQCRPTHTAHLNPTARQRLLRELERERRCTVQEEICAHLREHTIVFRYQPVKELEQSITWSTLEEDVLEHSRDTAVHRLDTMINHLKKVIQNSKSSMFKPRRSVHERRNRLVEARESPVPMKSTRSPTIDLSALTAMADLSSPLALACYSPYVPLVRFIDHEQLRTSNAQHLTCIQNVLPSENSSQHKAFPANGKSSPLSLQKSFQRSKSPAMNSSDMSPSRKRTLEKENCSVVSATHSNLVLSASSPLVPLKYTASPSSSRSYPNTRKHSLSPVSFATRRQKRRA